MGIPTLSTKKNATKPVTSSKMKIIVKDPMNWKQIKQITSLYIKIKIIIINCWVHDQTF